MATPIVAKLLEQGFRVRGTVRDPAKGAAHLRALPGAEERLELVAADLLDPASFAGVAEGVDVGAWCWRVGERGREGVGWGGERGMWGERGKGGFCVGDGA